jgi:hypothetical protein
MALISKPCRKRHVGKGGAIFYGLPHVIELPHCAKSPGTRAERGSKIPSERPAIESCYTL